MPNKIRNTQGRFIKIEDEEENEKKQKESFDYLFSEIKMSLPKLSLYNIFKIILILFLVSPWIYIFYRKGTFSYLNENISLFYEKTFPTEPICSKTEFGNGKGL